jgi:hypothetical protein
MIALNPAHRGLLHKELGVPEGKKLSVRQLARAARSKNPKERERANFAKNARKWNH